MKRFTEQGAEGRNCAQIPFKPVSVMRERHELNKAGHASTEKLILPSRKVTFIPQETTQVGGVREGGVRYRAAKGGMARVIPVRSGNFEIDGQLLKPGSPERVVIRSEVNPLAPADRGKKFDRKTG